MKTPPKNIDQFFYDQIDGATERPPAYTWEGIESALDQKQALTQQARQKRNRYALALFFVLMAGSASLLWKAMDFIDNQTQTVLNKQGSPEKLNAPAGRMISKYGQEKPGKEAIAASYANQPGNEYNSSFIIAHEVPAEAYSFTKENASTVPVERTGYIVESVPMALSTPYQTLTTSQAQPIEPPGVTSLRSKKTTISRWSLAVFFAPDITTRNLEQDRLSTADEGKEAIEKAERNGALDFTIGARVDYKLSKRFSIQSGISFSDNTIDIADKTVYARYDKHGVLRYKFNMSSGYAFAKLKKLPDPQFVGDSSRASGSTSTLRYINIPLAARYNFSIGKKLSFYLHAGITARFITGEKISTTYDYNGAKERNISREIEGLKKTYFNGVVGAGAEYALTKHVAVTVFPSFNFATSSINRDAPVKAYPNTLSIASGVKFTF